MLELQDDDSHRAAAYCDGQITKLVVHLVGLQILKAKHLVGCKIGITEMRILTALLNL